jgi:F-type H+-transporting ATPase subunit c
VVGGIIALAAGLGVALAAVGTATAQGRTASAAIDAIWRQPEAASEIRTSMMLALAFMEFLTIMVLLVSFMLIGKI